VEILVDPISRVYHLTAESGNQQMFTFWNPILSTWVRSTRKVGPLVGFGFRIDHLNRIRYTLQPVILYSAIFILF